MQSFMIFSILDDYCMDVIMDIEGYSLPLDLCEHEQDKIRVINIVQMTSQPLAAILVISQQYYNM